MTTFCRLLFAAADCIPAPVVRMRGMTPEDYAVSLLDRMLRDTPPGPRRDDILAIRSELLSGASLSELKKKYDSFDYRWCPTKCGG